MGAVKAMFDWDWKGAEASFQRAIALKDNLAEAHHWYARFVLGPLGRHDESIAEMKRALNSDPYAPILHTNLGVELYFARRFDETISQLQKVVDMEPRFNLPYWTLGMAWAAKGNLAKAVDSLETARRLAPGPKPDLILAYCYAAFREKGGGSRASRRNHSQLQPAFLLRIRAQAYVQSALHESEAAISSLKISLAEREPLLIEVGADPRYDWIRDNPEFSNILRSIGLNPGVYHHAPVPGLLSKGTCMTPDQMIIDLKLPQAQVDQIKALSASFKEFENILHPHPGRLTGYFARSKKRDRELRRVDRQNSQPGRGHRSCRH